MFGVIITETAKQVNVLQEHRVLKVNALN